MSDLEAEDYMARALFYKRYDEGPKSREELTAYMLEFDNPEYAPRVRRWAQAWAKWSAGLMTQARLDTLFREMFREMEAQDDDECGVIMRDKGQVIEVE